MRFHLHEISRTGKFMETESGSEVTRAGRQEKGELLFNTHGVSVWEDAGFETS